MRMKKTKWGDYEKRVLFPVFSNYQVRIVFSEDLAASYQRRFNRVLDRDSSITDAFHARMTGRSYLFFRIGDASSGTIAHECVHAIYALLVGWSGVEKFDDEILAYHVGYLTDQVVMCRNFLIDNKVGVKSTTEVQSNGICDSQGANGRVRRLQSRQATSGSSRTS